MIERDFDEFVRPLLEFGVDIESALYAAIEKNKQAIVELIVKFVNKDRPIMITPRVTTAIFGSERDNTGKESLDSPLKCAVCMKGTFILNYLIEKGHDINEKDEHDTALLHVAISQTPPNEEAIAILLAAGANPKIKSKQYGTPIEYAHQLSEKYAKERSAIISMLEKQIEMKQSLSKSESIDAFHLARSMSSVISKNIFLQLNRIAKSLGLSTLWELSSDNKAWCYITFEQEKHVEKFSTPHLKIERDGYRSLYILYIEKVSESVLNEIQSSIDNQIFNQASNSNCNN